jgi:hypothetical protein
LIGVLTPNFNIVDLVKFLEKNQKLHIQIVMVTLKVTSCRTMSKKKKKKKSEKPRFYGQTNYFLSTLPFSPWAVLATWVHVGAPQKIQEKRAQYPFSTKIYHGLIRSWNLTCLVFTESL